MRVIDATDLKVGRLASHVAKAALNGDSIAIVNSEKAVITGNRTTTIKRHLKRQDLGSRYQGPFFPKQPDRIVRRAIRGMLPYKKETGKKAFARIKTYLKIPMELEKAKLETLDEAKVSGLERRKYLNLGRLSMHLGSKHYQEDEQAKPSADVKTEEPKTKKEAKEPKQEAEAPVEEPKKEETA